MNRAEIIEGLKEMHGMLYAYIPHRKIFDLKIIEACVELLKNEDALIDKVLEIIDGYKSNAKEPAKMSARTFNVLLDRMQRDVLALKGGTE